MNSFVGLDQYTLQAFATGADDHIVGALQTTAVLYLEGGHPPGPLIPSELHHDQLHSAE